MFPQYTWSQIPSKFTSKTKASIADIEVTLIETHANLRILSRKGPSHLSKLVAGFQSLYLSILHLNVTTIYPLVLYSISAKVEEGCQLSSVDDIAGAVHHMLRIIEEDETALC
ncbi:transcription factor bHLH71-like [Herrania umbratica]|uniref:Transcription factor bHLH71-like n=1 Tax=Herrania umbratica TaxID=108875 RepID=A0A6J1AP74_9ROSI|nr:transcription factor bHLH71-like [Herrania umbratica]